MLFRPLPATPQCLDRSVSPIEETQEPEFLLAYLVNT
jgi:hypothetical protein